MTNLINIEIRYTINPILNYLSFYGRMEVRRVFCTAESEQRLPNARKQEMSVAL